MFVPLFPTDTHTQTHPLKLVLRLCSPESLHKVLGKEHLQVSSGENIIEYKSAINWISWLLTGTTN